MISATTQTTTTPNNDVLRENILAALCAFANQRPSIDPRNYGGGMDGWRAYREESRSVTKDLHDFRALFNSVHWKQSIDATRLQSAFRAYSGRLTCKVDGSRVTLDYCTGQYFPTEFRKAACAVLSAALWDWLRDTSMPAPAYRVFCTDDDGIRLPATSKRFDDRASADHYAATVAQSRRPEVVELYGELSAGDWLRRSFRREFGARLARRWFS
jgi:hypothetical protein